MAEYEGKMDRKTDALVQSRAEGGRGSARDNVPGATFDSGSRGGVMGLKVGPEVGAEVSPKCVSVGPGMGLEHCEVDSCGPRMWASDVGPAKPQDSCCKRAYHI